MSGPEAALAACRCLHDAAAMLLFGASAYLATLVPRDLARDVARRLTALLDAALAAAVLTSVAMVPVEAAVIGEGWHDAIDQGTVRAVLVETSLGTALLVQLGLAVLLLMARSVAERRRLGATAIASGLLLAALSLTGHAVMDEGATRIAHAFNDALHVLSGGAWLGALVPVAVLLTMLAEPERRGPAILALRRFSTAGHAAVALVLASGFANAVLILGPWPFDGISPYRGLLALKVAAVLGMVVLAVLNRYVLVPRLSRGSALAALRRLTITEIVLGLFALACVGVFGLLEPG